MGVPLPIYSLTDHDWFSFTAKENAMRSQRHRPTHPLPKPPVSDRRARQVLSVPYCDMAPGNILHARIPYIDGTGNKIRPVIVMKVLDNRVCIVTPITTSPNRNGRLHCLCPLQLSSGVRSWATTPLVIIDRKLDAVGVSGALDNVTWEILQREPWIQRPGRYAYTDSIPAAIIRLAELTSLDMAHSGLMAQ